jgi:conjugal transfer mating pair stabilization protein TraN
MSQRASISCRCCRTLIRRHRQAIHVYLGGDVYCLNSSCRTMSAGPRQFKDRWSLHSDQRRRQAVDQPTGRVLRRAWHLFQEILVPQIYYFRQQHCTTAPHASCSSAEKQLDGRTGPPYPPRWSQYSDKVLSVCVTSKDAYCCFSKLSASSRSRAASGCEAWERSRTETQGLCRVEGFWRHLSMVSHGR